ncbi:MAG: hypothetical protein M3450_07160 [Actinomycetota bacterium]|nr:hypothetical protein [Actinomycetota bacterium]
MTGRYLRAFAGPNPLPVASVVVRSRRALVGLVMALTAACSTPSVDRADPSVPPTTVEPVTTTAPTTTTLPVSAEVRDLAATTTMTERARRIFLAASPAIEDATTFAAHCGIDNRADSGSEPRTHTQGCYVAGRIHLLSPDRPEARELLYVVAAHELLHAVYASLGPVERSRIDAELQAARPGNQRLEERLKPYGASPTLINEVHSILGSEFDSVSPTLEAHYAQFFADRAAVVAARQRTLGDREDEIARLRADIDDLVARITARKETQEELRAANDIRGYDANVVVINRLIGRYNDQIDALNARIDEYNRLLGG